MLADDRQEFNQMVLNHFHWWNEESMSVWTQIYQTSSDPGNKKVGKEDGWMKYSLQIHFLLLLLTNLRQDSGFRLPVHIDSGVWESLNGKFAELL